jgi:hypothetical protein
MNTATIPAIVSVLVQGREIALVSGACGFLTETDGRLKTFSSVEDAKNHLGSEARIWPDYGGVDLEFARRWIGGSAKPTSLEVLDKLNDVYAVYMEILLAYSDYKDVPPDIQKECTRSHQVLPKLSLLMGQQLILRTAREKGWDTEKLVHGWGGEMKNEWTSGELEKLGEELGIAISFIENILAKQSA